MKTNIKNAIIIFIALLATNIGFAQSKNLKSVDVKVSGSCGMCKKTIEKAAKQAGAKEADWNKETGILMVKFDSAKSDAEKIQRKISAAGYDTEKFKADEKAYAKLKKCCKYER